MVFVEWAVLLLIAAFLYVFAGFFFVATALPRASGVSADCRLSREGGSLVLTDRIDWVAAPFGLLFIGIGCATGYALINTFAFGGAARHWMLFPPLFLLFGLNVPWMGLCLACGWSRMIVDRESDRLLCTSYLGPVPFRRRARSLSSFQFVQVKVETRGRFAGRRWIVYLTGGEHDFEAGGGNELSAYKLAQAVAQAAQLPVVAGPESNQPAARRSEFTERVRKHQQVIYRSRLAGAIGTCITLPISLLITVEAVSHLRYFLAGPGADEPNTSWFEWLNLGVVACMSAFSVYAVWHLLTRAAIGVELRIDRQQHALIFVARSLVGARYQRAIQAADVTGVRLEKNSLGQWTAVVVGQNGARQTLDRSAADETIRQLALDASEALGVPLTVVEAEPPPAD